MGNRAAAWAVAGPLIGFKIAVVALILVAAPESDTVGFLVATNWPLVVILALLVGGPALAWWRLVQVRARRSQLRRAEWMVDTDPRDELPALDTDSTQWPLWETVARLEDRG